MPAGKVNFFAKDKNTDFVIKGLTGELNTKDADFDIADTQLSGGQNTIPASATSLKKRDGINTYGQFLGSAIGTDGGWSFVGANGVQEELVVYNGSLYRLVGATWTAVTGVSLTAGLPCSGVYFANTDLFYIVNGTNNVVKYQAGSTAALQTDAAFPKGKYVTTFQGILVVGCIAGFPNQVSYSTAGVDTFQVGYFFVLPGEFNIAITGLLNFNNIMLMISTRRRLFRIQNFAFDGTKNWVSQLYELPNDFGAIYERTMCVVGGYGYFLGQDMSNVAGIYITDGYTARNISYDKILATTQGLNAQYLNKACAIADSVFYKVYVPNGTDTTNTLGIIYDTVKKIFLTPENRFVKSLSDFSCLWSTELAGKWQIFAGSSEAGRVYKLHGNAGLYDELSEEQYNPTMAATNETSIAIDANPAKRGAQSFKLSNYNITYNVNITQVPVYIKTNGGTSANLTLRIETDNNGKPSGVLADTNAAVTIAATSVTSNYGWIPATFAISPQLKGNTLYWIVIKHITEGSGNSAYLWHSRSDGNYANGNSSSYASSTSATTDTYSPDANPETTSVDGEVAAINADQYWAGLRSNTGNFASDSNNYTEIKLLANARDPLAYDKLSRGYILFDTSPIPNDATITSAKVSLYITGKQDDFGGQALNITAGTPTSNTALVAADFAVANFGSTKFATDKTLSSLSANAYNDFTLNASGLAAISLTGITKFAVRLAGDITNTAPLLWNATYQSFATYNNSDAGINFAPKLVITYSTASGVFTWTTLATTDANFVMYVQSPIDLIADTKAYVPNANKEFVMRKYQTVFSNLSTSSVVMQIGFADTNFDTFNITNLTLNVAGGNIFGTTAEGGSNKVFGTTDEGGSNTVFGGQQKKQFTYTDVPSFTERVLKVRIRNNQANQQFEWNQIKCILTPRMRDF